MVQRLLKLPIRNRILLLGPRGTGKSTLVMELLAQSAELSALWVDLLKPEQEEEFLRNPGLLRDRITAISAKTVVIDEVQKVPALLDIAHEMIESKGIRFILTGSSARKLKRGGANMLAGRAISLHLDAFSYLELQGRFHLKEALEFGLLPKIYFPQRGDASVVWTSEEKISFLQTYARTYLREEIQLEQHVRKIQPFRNFLELAAQMNGKIVEYSNLARDTGVDHKTVAEYFQILEDTLIGFFLEPFHRSIRRRQGKKPKFYFFDTGVKRALDRTLTIPLLPRTSAYGEAFEHFVILEFRKQAQVVNSDIRLSFFRTHDGHSEIDLIVEKPGHPLCLIEIKSAEKADEIDVKKLLRIGAEFGDAKLFILCQETSPREIHGVRILPWSLGIEEVLALKALPLSSKDKVPKVAKKTHPWRLCPAGEHWVSSHQERIPPSKRNPAGITVTRHAHCAKSPSGLDELYPAEITEIANQHFSSLKNMPCPTELGFKGRGATYDNLIAGWVQYWNDVLQPDSALAPNLVKALIATESSFLPSKLANRKKQNSARGLMQITNETRALLGGKKGGLKDHLVIATRQELNDPNVNICAGIRWLFYKKVMASDHLGKNATWEEAVMNYKGLFSETVTKKQRVHIMNIFNEKFEDLKKCKG